MNNEEIASLSMRIKESSASNIRLYLVNRVEKEGSPRSRRTLDRHTFPVFQVSINDNLQNDFHHLISNQLSELADDNEIALTDYSIISNDSTREIFTYRDENRALPFCKDVFDALEKGSDIQPLHSLHDVSEHLWAYCIQIQHNDGSQTLTFTRIYKNRVAIDENSDKNRSFKKRIFAKFDVNESMLIPLEQQTINFSRGIDCLYANGKFYIVHKKGFEQIFELGDEFQRNATDFISRLEASELVTGLELVSTHTEAKPRYLRILAKISKDFGEDTLTPERANQMLKICSDYGLTINSSNGRIIIENAEDVRTFIRLLDDYYLKSEQTGRLYGTHSKELV